jgi:hypothetical protein
MQIKTLIIIALCTLSLRAAPQTLPPLPPNVTEIKFSEFFEGPIGDRGLRISDKSKSLEGKRVRMLGHVVRQDHPSAGMFLLSPVPVQLHDEHYGLADDLPAATVFVSIPSDEKRSIEYKQGIFLVTGVLRLGNREEADGRISIFRIEMDRPEKPLKRAVLPVRKTGETRLSRRLHQ